MNVASIAVMALVTAQLARTAIVDVATGLMVATAALLVIRFRVNSAWLVLAGALIGFALYRPPVP